MVQRLRATEESLRNSYQLSFAKIGGGPEHEYKSTALAGFLKGLSWTMVIVAIICLIGSGTMWLHEHCSNSIHRVSR